MTIRQIQGTISLLALVIILARILWPALNIDSITLGLLAIAILPWLAPLVKSAELPGGLKIEFQDLQAAADKVTGKGESAIPPGPAADSGPVVIHVPTGELRLEGFPPSVLIGPPDPNLDLVAIRIEIEKRVRALAKKVGHDPTAPLTLLISSFAASRILTKDEAAGLRKLVDAGNRAAHGAEVDPTASTWARTMAQEVLAFLDKKISSQ